MMLKVILETWGEKIKLKRVFPHCKTLNFDKKQKKNVVTSITASQQPLFAVPEHNTHPVDMLDQFMKERNLSNLSFVANALPKNQK